MAPVTQNTSYELSQERSHNGNKQASVAPTELSIFPFVDPLYHLHLDLKAGHQRLAPFCGEVRQSFACIPYSRPLDIRRQSAHLSPSRPLPISPNHNNQCFSSRPPSYILFILRCRAFSPAALRYTSFQVLFLVVPCVHLGIAYKKRRFPRRTPAAFLFSPFAPAHLETTNSRIPENQAIELRFGRSRAFRRGPRWVEPTRRSGALFSPLFLSSPLPQRERPSYSRRGGVSHTARAPPAAVRHSSGRQNRSRTIYPPWASCFASYSFACLAFAYPHSHPPSRLPSPTPFPLLFFLYSIPYMVCALGLVMSF